MRNHYNPKCLSDRLSSCLVCLLRQPADLYFGKDYVRRAMVIETIAALPGMIGGKFQHYKSLRWMRTDHGWSHLLLSEAENERAHLMTMLAIGRPTLMDRILVWPLQFGFCVLYSLAYILSPRICHRFVGYLEEEAIRSYTFFLEEINAGHIRNPAAPGLAKKLWELPEHARLSDVIMAIRADEMRHRDNNHHLASQMGKGRF
ncbi:MAG: hypothetical protein A2018_00330 [Alphaproteobacteria bacterium GWF2_58_20]|nr:MAG: hypothetical protein A2018_00330 [Alphaproteobacteria bacterium GWF2_58_20]